MTRRREIKTLEKTIAQLDEQKRTLNAQLMESTDADEALRLHNEISALTEQLNQAEEPLVPAKRRDRRC